MRVHSKIGLRAYLLQNPLMPKPQNRREQTLSECEYFVNLIVYEQAIRELDPNNFVSLNKQVLEQIITSRKKPLVMNLLRDVIEINHSYRAGSYSKSYKLQPKWRNAKSVQVKLSSKRISDRIAKRRYERNKYFLKFEKHRSIIHNLQELRVSYSDAVKAVEKRAGVPFSKVLEISKMPKHKDYKRFFRYLNDFDNAVSLSRLAERNDWEAWLGKLNYKESKVGRVFHTYSDMFKELRKAHAHKSGKRLVSIDMSNALPTFLAALYTEQSNKKMLPHISNGMHLHSPEQSKEKKVLYVVTFFKTFLDGKFYSSLQNWLKEQDNKLGLLEHKEFKVKVLSYLFMRVLPTDSNSFIQKAMQAVYPDFDNWIREVKQNDYKKLSHIAMQMESNLFVNRTFGEYRPFGRFAYPVHDELNVLEGDEVEAQNFLQSSIFELYGIKAAASTFHIEQ